MMITRNLLIAAVIFFTTSLTSNATHIAGGNIAYSCTATPNQFLITLTLYRDCSGISAPFSTVINFTNDCGLPNPSLTLSMQSSSEVSQLCTPELPNSTCSGGSLPGMQEYIYTGTVMLNPVCNAWTMSYQVCDRNSSTNLVGTNCFHIKTKLYSGNAVCNNSPVITAQPIPYVCANVPVSYDFGVLEPDGNTLQFSLVNALGTGGTNIMYSGTYTAAEPIPGITINPVTGQLNFTSAIPGKFVVAVLIEEFDGLGNIVGSIMQDIQFVVQICPNTPPNAPLTITNFDNFGTNAVLTGGNTITLCTDDEFCFDVVFDDPDLADNLTLSSNIDLFLPGATFTQTGTNPATATICWTFQTGYTGSIISVVANDEVCPIPGIASFPIDLDVPPPLNPGTDETVDLCTGSAPINMFDLLGGSPQVGGVWLDSNGDPVNPIALPDTIISGVYEYILGDISSACTASAFLTISVTGIDATWVPASLANVSCFGFNDGTALVNNIVGTGTPFDVEWINGGTVIETSSVMSGGTSGQNDLGPGSWTVSITNQAGCNWSQNFTITEPAPLASPGTDSSFHICQDAATINLFNFLGGSPATGGTWLNSGGTVINPVVSPSTLLPGVYEYVIGNISTVCTTSAFVTVAVTGVTANWDAGSLSNGFCGPDNGTALVNNIVGTGGPFNVQWINGATVFESLSVTSGGSSFQDDLGSGNWTVLITNQNGCTWSQPFIISEPLPLTISFNSNTPSCYQFSDASVTANLANGTGPYTFIMTNSAGTQLNVANSNTINNIGSGWYYALITDVNGCTAYDSIFVNEPDRLEIVLDITQPLCYGVNDGIAVVDTVLNYNGSYNGISYFWNPNPSGVSGIGANTSTQLGAGTYIVTVNDANGCSRTFEFVVEYEDSLYFVELEAYHAFCRTLPSQVGHGRVFAATAGGTSPYSYLWTNLTTGATTTNTTWGGLNPGDYQITTTDNNGCILIDIVTVEEVDPIAEFEMTSPQFTSDYYGTAPVDVHFVNQSEYFADQYDPLADTTFFWHFGLVGEPWVMSESLYETFDQTYTVGGTYEICLVAINMNNCKDTACKTMVVYDQLTFLPINVFTPDGDGINDGFSFYDKSQAVSVFNCVIVNRWGIQIFEMNDITDSWDGSDKNGDVCSDGVYFYTYEGTADNGTPFKGQGTIQLINSKK